MDRAPGADRQLLHRDEAVWVHLPKPHPEVELASVIALVDFTARAIRCPCAIRDAAGGIGLAVRPGLHTGECDRVGEKIGGLAVHIGARVAGHAEPGEVLVSRGDLTDLDRQRGQLLDRERRCDADASRARSWHRRLAEEAPCLAKAGEGLIAPSEEPRRLRAIVPNLMGYDSASLPPTYHAFYDPAAGLPKPNDGRPVYPALRPDFVWPAGD